MNVQRATAAIVLAACFALVSGAQARPAHHLHHRHAQPISGSVAHTGVMNAGELSLTVLPVDGIATVNGIEIGCTGIGIEARENPRWKDFPVRVEFSGSYHQYFPGGTLVVKEADHKPLVYVSCDAPWVLIKLEPGKYRLAGLMEGYSHPQSWLMVLKPNRAAPRRIVFHFREITGSKP